MEGGGGANNGTLQYIRTVYACKNYNSHECADKLVS